MFLYVLWLAVRYAFITALVLTYVDLGPGGAYLGKMIDAFRGYLGQVDWSVFGRVVLDFVLAILRELLQLVRDMAAGAGK